MGLLQKKDLIIHIGLYSLKYKKERKMSDGITLYCPRCGNLSCLKKEYDNYKGLEVYTCQKKDCGRRFIIELVIKQKGGLNSSQP